MVTQEFAPSTYQKAIFEWVLEGSGDCMVSAVAGSGKTTTLVEVGKLLPREKRAIFLAFNKHIAEELASRLAGTVVQARTIHSVGNATLYREFGRLTVRVDKYGDICWRAIERAFPEYKSAEDGKREIATLAKLLARLVDLGRLTLNDKNVSALIELAQEHSLDIENGKLDKLARLVESVCREGVWNAETLRVIDYTDMVWMPVVLNLPTEKFDFILVDEAQDLNAAQRKLVYKLRAEGGRAIWVGDPHQAIMGFAGADFDSYYAIKEECSAIELPLSICYRCPRSHVELAQQIVPEIEAREDAPEGEILDIVEAELYKHVRERDLVGCRLVAPLIGQCINLIRHDIPARVRGRDIAKTLVNLAERLAKTKQSWEDFPKSVEEHRTKQAEKLSKRKNPENQLLVLNDTCDALQACYEEFDAPSVEVFCSRIEGIFADDRATVWLSTIHKAKGLEADRVFILKPHKLPLVWSRQTEQQFEQEMNLKYVALTRAKQTLTWVREKKEEKSTDAGGGEKE